MTSGDRPQRKSLWVLALGKGVCVPADPQVWRRASHGKTSPTKGRPRWGVGGRGFPRDFPDHPIPGCSTEKTLVLSCYSRPCSSASF